MSDFAPCLRFLVRFMDWKGEGERILTIPNAMVFALLGGAPGALTKRRRTAEPPIARRTRMSWSMCTANLYRLSKKPIFASRDCNVLFLGSGIRESSIIMLQNAEELKI